MFHRGNNSVSGVRGNDDKVLNNNLSKVNNNIWWNSASKNSKEKNLEEPLSFSGEICEFCSNFTLHSYRWLVESNRSNWELLLWIIVHLISFLSMLYILLNAYDSYTTNPLITSLYDTLYPVGKVPFPAISLCNNNRISKSAARIYAKSLIMKDENDSYVDEIEVLEKIRHLGKLYDNELDNEIELIDFQEFLDRNDLNSTDKSYDTRTHLKGLSPQCSDTVIRCIWRGVEVPCMKKNEMLEFRSTQYGYCCTFNYVRPDMIDEIEPTSFYESDTGPELGLIMLINGSHNDYFYPYYNFIGFIVQIFNPNEFPDVPSGSVSEKLVELGHETFIRVDSSTLLTERETQRYAPSTRACLFPDELQQEFGGRYKRSDCVVNCRVTSIVALCNCLVFYLPLSNTPSTLDVPLCTLENIPCLNHYRVKWSTMLLDLKKVIGLEKELEDGLYCPQCLPSCSDTIYKVSSQKLPLVPTKRSYRNLFTLCAAAFSAGSTDELMSNLFASTPITMASVKALLLLYNRNILINILTQFAELDTMVDLKNPPEERIIILNMPRRARNLLIFKVVNVSLIIVMAYSMVLFSPEPKLLWPAIFPYDWKQSSLIHWLTVTYQLICNTLLVISYTFSDIYGPVLYIILSAYFDVLYIKLEKIGKKNLRMLLVDNINQNLISGGDGMVVVGSTTDVKCDMTNTTDEEELYVCIKFHQICLQIVNDLNQLLKVHLFMQFTFSAIVFCASAFNLSVINPKEEITDFIFMSIFLNLMGLEIFIPCYFGSSLSETSDKLCRYIFRSNWVDQSKRFKTTMNIFLSRSQKPILLTTWQDTYFIRLPTFVSVCRFAYSLLTCLKAR